MNLKRPVLDAPNRLRAGLGLRIRTPLPQSQALKSAGLLSRSHDASRGSGEEPRATGASARVVGTHQLKGHTLGHRADRRSRGPSRICWQVIRGRLEAEGAFFPLFLTDLILRLRPRHKRQIHPPGLGRCR